MSNIKLKALEREDLRFVHSLDNNRAVMSYWFEEPYESFDELIDLYDKHIHDANERRFVAWLQENGEETPVGLVELIEINNIHRTCEFQIIIAPAFQGRGFAQTVTTLALDWAFKLLNLRKVYLLVATQNEKAIHIYKKVGFEIEGTLKQEFWSNGQYEDVLRMALFQNRFTAITHNGSQER